MSIILASASPQRKKLLEQIGLEFTVIPGMVDESMSDGLPPEEQVQEIALKKAQWVAEENPGFEVVIGADTIVVYQDRILGKPHNLEEAGEMLRLLSGTTHCVLTGVAVVTPSKTLLDVVSTEVSMKSLSDDEIMSYLATGEPIGKAGAVCIQGIGARFIKGINGCFYNVVGLPLVRLVEMLEEAGNRGQHPFFYHFRGLPIAFGLNVRPNNSSNLVAKVSSPAGRPVEVHSLLLPCRCMYFIEKWSQNVIFGNFPHLNSVEFFVRNTNSLFCNSLLNIPFHLNTIKSFMFFHCLTISFGE
ncbi:hypothetical protein COZ13_04895 [Candidatus Desantisbacteria bacterium CG_4_10_14_3_um_filter_40_18]|uniref:Nucleoside triphosphate pyrophosphatase n=1 Tax=Candidatus Desantisbacteria bacterium CG_4_10_14_3_um_filter_40_18 TaxID=1974544 RepID=A0A2M7P1V9_9BACT|nr:MAG: hypothetical protein COZ13_04895 [Candidatus Desantisbacteria bacterium CG_4_10_14_3_um_filter_40_18]